jgi:hypothetical protein
MPELIPIILYQVFTEEGDFLFSFTAEELTDFLNKEEGKSFVIRTRRISVAAGD